MRLSVACAGTLFLPPSKKKKKKKQSTVILAQLQDRTLQGVLSTKGLRVIQWCAMTIVESYSPKDDRGTIFCIYRLLLPVTTCLSAIASGRRVIACPLLYSTLLTRTLHDFQLFVSDCE